MTTRVAGAEDGVSDGAARLERLRGLQRRIIERGRPGSIAVMPSIVNTLVESLSLAQETVERERFGDSIRWRLVALGVALPKPAS